MLLTTYNDLSSIPLFSPDPFPIPPYLCVLLVVPLVGPLVVPFEGVVDCMVVPGVVLLFAELLMFSPEGLQATSVQKSNQQLINLLTVAIIIKETEIQNKQ